jgi:hypothetical protein
MKKTIFTCIIFASFASLLPAQIYVEGVRLNADNTGQYIELDPQFRTDGRCAFRVDYGQSNPKEDHVTDAYGKQLDFRSLVDGLNVFYAEGWQVDQVTLVGNDRRYLLKRRY